MLNQNSVKWCSYLGIVSVILLSQTDALAQSNIVPDETLENAERSRVVPLDLIGLPLDIIDGGAIRGTHLFHSFEEFNVAELRGAYFRNPSNEIQNILARVTGNNSSKIFGTLGIFNAIGVTSNPNLFLMNPNGIVFGSNASLDVPASFLATSANAIKLGDNGLFSASEPAKSSLLTINPSALLFNNVSSGSIINQSRSRQTVTEQVLGSSFNAPAIIDGLEVLKGQSLLLVGGDINIENGNLTALEGRVELGSVVGNGLVSFNQTDKGLVLGYEGVQNFGDIKISGDIEKSRFALVNTTGERGGNIQIQGRQLLLKNGSFIVTGARTGKEGGEILIRTTDAVIVDDSVIGGFVDFGTKGNSGSINIETKKLNIFGGISNFGGFISTATSGEGNAGNIIIKAEQISLTNGGEIQTDTFDKGNAGNITIFASDFVEVIGKSVSDNNLSSINTQVSSNASGSGGNLLIETKRLRIQDGGQVRAGTFGTGIGGNLTVITPDSVEIIATDAGGSPSGLFTATFGAADAGNLTIDTGKLSIRNGGTVSASTFAVFGKGRGGNLTITASDSVEIFGTSAKNSEGSQFFSSLVTETGRLLNFASGIEPALGGNLTINTKRLTIRDGGRVSTATYGFAGKAGDLSVTAKESIEVIGKDTDGNLSNLTAKTIGTGDAGNLTINTQQLIIRGGAEVSTSTSSDDGTLQIKLRGQGGVLNVTASDFVEVSGVNSGLVSLSFLSTGDAGKVKINTGRLIIRDGATVSTSSIGRGRGGDLEITASDLVELSGSGVSFDERFGVGEFVRPSSLSTEAISIKNAGDLSINTGQLIIRDGAEVSARTEGQGKGGDIRVQANSVNLTNRAVLTSRSDRQPGSAGNIFLNIGDRLQASDSNISSTSDISTGGAINITARDVRLSSDSDISTNVFSGTGGGGNITLTANSIIAFDDSDILAFARDGKGGDITFNTPAFFGQNYKPTTKDTDPTTLDDNNRVDINATGAVSGVITLPDTTFIQNSLTELQQNLIDTNALISNSCIARNSKQEGIFIITGSGGLPNRPGDASVSSYPTGTVQGVIPDTSSWKKGDPIIEPTGVYRLGNGQLVMSRECL